MPAPRPDSDDKPFWDACRARRLIFQRCAACQAWRHPPGPVCPACQSQESRWQEAAGEIELYTWTRIWTAGHASVAADLPYLVGVVAFPSCGGVRLMARLSQTGAGDPRIGAPCRLTWIDAEDGPRPAFELLG